MLCQHMNFQAVVAVGRLTRDGEPADAKPYAFTADVRIRCAECGLAFEFTGLPAGVNPFAPMVSIDGQELRAPIVPAGGPTSPLAKLAGELGEGETRQ